MTEERLARIRFLSTRFHELQGLRVALAGATIVLVFGSYLVVTPAPSDPGALVALLVSFVAIIPSQWWIHRYYARTFGRQVWQPRISRKPFAFLIGYQWLAFWLDRKFPAIPAGAPTLAIVTLISLYVAIRDWRWRAYYAFVPAAVGAAFGASANVGGLLDPHLTLAIIFLSLGGAMVAVGILDHSLLVRLVREAQATATAPAATRD